MAIKTFSRERSTQNIIRNPSAEQVADLLAEAGNELRGIEGYDGAVYLWPYAEATHMMAAGILGIPYDPATDYVNNLTGKTFYIRSLDDWTERERRRQESGSFTYQVKQDANQNH